MFVEPNDFDREGLRATLRDAWGLSVSALRYEPVGFGTHHYVATDDDATRWFVNVDDFVEKAWLADDPSLTFAALDRALRTAVALRHAGLEFVHAPVETSNSDVVVRLDDRYAVSVSGYIDGSSNEGGEFASTDERRRVLTAVGQIHAASDLVPSELPRRDTLAVPLRERFFETLDDLASPWTSGPFAESARTILVESSDAVREMLTITTTSPPTSVPERTRGS